MGILSKIFTRGAKELVDSLGSVIDNVTTTDAEKLAAKNKLSNIVFSVFNKLQDARRDIILAEAKGNWLQRSWRPLVMLTFAAIVAIGAFVPIPYLADKSEFWSLLKIGMGGYVIGRSVEKVADNVTKNIDLSSLRKKDRAEKYD